MTNKKKQDKSLGDKALDALDEYPLAFKVEIDPANKLQTTMLYASIAVLVIVLIVATIYYGELRLSIWLSIIGTIILNVAIFAYMRWKRK